MFAGPSWTYLVHFKLMDMEHKLDKDPEQIARLLRHVVTDGPFHRAARSRQPTDILHSRTMVWSLCYYLAQRNLDGLRRFCQELAQLLRDLDFDTEIYFDCFARAFGLEDPKQPGRIDPVKLRQLGYRLVQVQRPDHAIADEGNPRRSQKGIGGVPRKNPSQGGRSRLKGIAVFCWTAWLSGIITSASGWRSCTVSQGERDVAPCSASAGDFRFGLPGQRPALAADDMTVEGTVLSAGKGKLTITGADKKEHSCMVAKDAKITCNGKECKLDDLKKGAKVKVTVEGKGKKAKATKIEATVEKK